MNDSPTYQWWVTDHRNRIIGTAVQWRDEHGVDRVDILTTDTDWIGKADHVVRRAGTMRIVEPTGKKAAA